jgi:hypothetical protein
LTSRKEHQFFLKGFFPFLVGIFSEFYTAFRKNCVEALSGLKNVEGIRSSKFGFEMLRAKKFNNSCPHRLFFLPLMLLKTAKTGIGVHHVHFGKYQAIIVIAKK